MNEVVYEAIDDRWEIAIGVNNTTEFDTFLLLMVFKIKKEW